MVLPFSKASSCSSLLLLSAFVVLVCSVIGTLVSAAHQQPFQVSSRPALDISYPTAHSNNTNPLDVLTSSPNHTIFVRLLQRTRLIPTLIRLVEFDDGSGITILAPTDEAFRKEAEASQAHGSLWSQALLNLDGSDDLLDSRDNIQAELRQHLLHHILNYTLSYETIANLSDAKDAGILSKTSTQLPIDAPHMHSTMYFPSRRALHEPSKPGPIPQPPGGPRHPGADDGGGLLGGHGQKVRTIWKWRADDDASSLKEDESRRGSLWFGVDAKGSGGVGADQAHHVKGGVVVFIDGLIPIPPTLEEAIRTHPSLSTLSNILDEELLHSLSFAAHSTVFLPTASSFEALPRLQQSYLLRNVSAEEQKDAWQIVQWDRTKLAGWHISGRGLKDELGEWGVVGYAEALQEAVNEQGEGQLTTILGGSLHYNFNASSQEPALTIAGAKLVEQDILIENGVIHLVDAVLVPRADALQLNVEKTLLALNASRFVGMLKRTGLESYLLGGGSDDQGDHDDGDRDRQQWTFAVPADDVLDAWLRENQDIGRWWRAIEGSEPGLSRTSQLILESDDDEDDTEKLRDLLKYHIIPGLVQPQNLSESGLVPTELRGWRLKEGRQRILTTITPAGGRGGKKTSPDADDDPDITFNGANVVSAPVYVGHDAEDKDHSEASAVIYLISRLLTPPDHPIQTAVSSSLTLSTFVAAVFSTELDAHIKRAPGITYLIPNNDAFEALGLIMSYLLLPGSQSKSELRRLIEYHAVDQIVYIEDFDAGQKRYPTLEGPSIWAGRDVNNSNAIVVRREAATDAEGNALIDAASGRPAKIRSKDLLTSTGVIHEIDKVELPPDLELTVGKLLRGAQCDTFHDLVNRAGYGWILNGTAPPEDPKELSIDDDTDDDDVDILKKSGRKRRQKKHKQRHRLFRSSSQSYILLAPTDAAFAKINVSHYLARPEELKKLIQLHILPSPSLEDEENRALSEQGIQGDRKLLLPVGLKDGLSLPSLLDQSLGGVSAYGKVAFRRVERLQDGTRSSEGKDDDREDGDEEPDLGYLVGILGSRGSSTPLSGSDEAKEGDTRSHPKHHSAHLTSFGRESLPLPLPKDSSAAAIAATRRSIGGVFTIDSVLEPYHPNWFHRFGWIVLVVIGAVLLAALAAWGIHRWWVYERGGANGGRGRKGTGNGGGELGEAMEGEEE